MAQPEIARATVDLDGSMAGEELKRLGIRAKELRGELSKAFSANDAAAVKKYEKELKLVTGQMKSVKQSTIDVEQVLKRLNGSSFNELTAAHRKLSSEIKRMTTNTKEEIAAYKEKVAVLKQVDAQLGKVKTEMGSVSQAQKGWLGNVSSGFNKLFLGIAAGTAALTGIVAGFNRAKDAANEYEEALGNLSALTGLQGEDLEWLSEKAKESSIKTTEAGIRIRQSAKDILDAYTIMGSQRPELLKNKEALAQVTEQAIILSEAGKIKLEPAVTALANTMNQFNLEGEEAARIINIIAAGSKVGAADIDYVSTAIEKAGTTANLMGISVEQAVGMIETVGPKFAEAAMAGNGLDKVMLKMSEKQIGYKDGVFDMGRALDELATRFASGESATSIFGMEHAKMAEVLVQGREELKRYTKEVTGTSVAIEQAGINTDTNAAKLAQAKNKMSLVAIEMGSKVAPAFTFAANAMAGMGNALLVLIKFLSEYRGIIIQGAAAVAAYAIVVNAAAIAKGLYSAATWIANTATKAFNATMKLNPWGLLASVIAVAVVGLIEFSRHMKTVSSETKAQTRLNDALAESISKELGPMTQLFEKLKSVSISTTERKETIKQLNEQYGQYLPSLFTEKTTLQEIETAQNAANIALEQSITKKVRAQVLTDLITAKIQKQMYLEAELKNQAGDVGIDTLLDSAKEARDIIDQRYEYELSAAGLAGKAKKDLKGKELEDFIRLETAYNTNVENLRKEALNQGTFDTKEMAKARKELNDITLQLTETEQLINDAIQREGGSKLPAKDNGGGGGGGGGGETEEQKKKREAREAKEKEYRAQVILDSLSLIERENADYDERLKNAGIFLKAKGDMTAEELRVSEILEKEHQKKLSDINNQALSDDILENKKNFDQVTMIQQTAHNKELAALGKNEKAKEILEKKFQAGQTQRQMKHLQELIAQLQGALAGEDTFKGIDEMLLTEEQKEALKARIAEIEKAYSELMLTAAGQGEEKEQTGFQKFAGNADDVDIFGMSGKKWADLLRNLEDGKIGLDEIVALIGTMQQAWSMVNEIRANQEAQAMMDYEGSIEKRKQLLQNQLDAGKISQESYNKQVAAMDADLDKKKKELAIKQAKREKAMALVSAIVNLAAGVIKALATSPIWVGIVLAALVGVMGGLQIAKIASTPIPQFAAGKYDVIGNKDGKKYSARVIDSPGTGLITEPSILVGEKPEIIIDPYTTRNMQVNFPELIKGINMARVPQFASGQYSSSGTGGTLKEPSSPELNKILAGLTVQMGTFSGQIERLSDRLDKGIGAKLVADGDYVEKHNEVMEDYDALHKQVNLRS